MLLLWRLPVSIRRCAVALRLLGWLLSFLGEEDGLNVGQHTTLGNGDSGEQFVELLVVTDGELQMAWNDPALLVVAGSIACQLEDLGSEVFHDGCQVDRGSSTHSLGVVSFPQVTVDTSDWELETCTAAAGLGLALGLSSFASA